MTQDPRPRPEQTILTGSDEEPFRQRYQHTQRGEWTSWEWAGSGRPFPWLGLLLVLLGAGLLIQQLAPGVTFTSLLLLALGIAFAVAWLVGRARWATTPALLLLALALGRLVDELGVLPRGDWASLFVGLALLAVWAIGRAQGAQRTWAALLGGIFVIIAVARLSGSIPGWPDLGLLWPVLIIGAGLFLVLSGRIGGARP